MHGGGVKPIIGFNDEETSRKCNAKGGEMQNDALLRGS
jgi:hypothetical protein